MSLSDYFHLPSVSANSVLTSLKVTQVSKEAGIDNLSGHFHGQRSWTRMKENLYPDLSLICVISQLPLKRFHILAR